MVAFNTSRDNTISFVSCAELGDGGVFVSFFYTVYIAYYIIIYYYMKAPYQLGACSLSVFWPWVWPWMRPRVCLQNIPF